MIDRIISALRFDRLFWHPPLARNRIRTIGPAEGARHSRGVGSRSRRASVGRQSGRSDVSRSRNLGRVTRNRWFESGSLQRRVSCELNCRSGRLTASTERVADSIRRGAMWPCCEAWLSKIKLWNGRYLFPSRFRAQPHLSIGQYARIVHAWVESAELDSSAYGTHSMRRTKAAQVYARQRTALRSNVESLLRPRAAARGTAATALSTLSTTKPATPSSIISGTEPRLNPMIGVPLAIASIMTNPKAPASR